tara:strand:+ start:508 stop:726 length:219 start_codon:yes stop_codon:yes gene_type:complete
MEEDETFNTYMAGVSSRLDSLSDKDKNTLASISGSKVGSILTTVLGPSMEVLGGSRLRDMQPKKKRGLAARK